MLVANGYVWARDHLAEIALGAVVFGIVAIVVLLIMASSAEHQKWIAWCQTQGGHTDSHTDVHTVPVTSVDSKGNVSTGISTSTSTIEFCLTEDGRILDVR